MICRRSSLDSSADILDGNTCHTIVMISCKDFGYKMKRLDDRNKSTTEHNGSRRTLDRQAECLAGRPRHLISVAEIPPAKRSARDGARHDIGDHLFQDDQS